MYRALLSGLFAAVVVQMGSVAEGAFLLPSGWTRGDVNSTYQEWNVFVAANHPASHPADVGLFNPNGAPLVSDTGGGSFATGGGNIYSPGALADIDVFVPNYNLGPGTSTVVILQTHTLGTEIDPSTVLLGGVAPNLVREISRTAIRGQGFDVEQLWRWDLSSNAASYTPEFKAQGIHLSLARAVVDTYSVVPEPATVLLAAIAAAGLVAAWRRRRAAYAT